MEKPKAITALETDITILQTKHALLQGFFNLLPDTQEMRALKVSAIGNKSMFIVLDAESVEHILRLVGMLQEHRAWINHSTSYTARPFIVDGNVKAWALVQTKVGSYCYTAFTKYPLDDRETVGKTMQCSKLASEARLHIGLSINNAQYDVWFQLKNDTTVSMDDICAMLELAPGGGIPPSLKYAGGSTYFFNVEHSDNHGSQDRKAHDR